MAWTFIGTKYFTETNAAVAVQREWLLAFFSALEKSGREEILAELKILREQIQ